jgi:hypothetical protein
MSDVAEGGSMVARVDRPLMFNCFLAEIEVTVRLKKNKS